MLLRLKPVFFYFKVEQRKVVSNCNKPERLLKWANRKKVESKMTPSDTISRIIWKLTQLQTGHE